jgi:NADPH:quinone reductase-like Zn-dependent oxidoreductase
MRAYVLDHFGLDGLKLQDVSVPALGPGEVLLDVKALSLNYRDLMVIKGVYNPRFKLPAVPLSDGAGIIRAVAEGVTRCKPGDWVMTHFVSGWLDGPYRAEYTGTTLGLPRAGLAAEQVALPADAIVAVPEGYDFQQAATLPIAGSTAWSALVRKGQVQPGQTVLTLGTGGVSIFALQFAKTLGARAIITSSRADKLERARALGADVTINYRTRPDWDKAVLEATDGLGADITVETGGAGTLNQSMLATRAGGVIGMLGALTGLKGADIDVGLILRKELHIAGILTGPRAGLEALRLFLMQRQLRPAIDRVFGFEELPEALRYMESASHFGKIVIDAG